MPRLTKAVPKYRSTGRPGRRSSPSEAELSSPFPLPRQGPDAASRTAPVDRKPAITTSGSFFLFQLTNSLLDCLHLLAHSLCLLPKQPEFFLFACALG